MHTTSMGRDARRARRKAKSYSRDGSEEVRQNHLPLASESAGELDVLGLDGDTLGVDGL